MVIAPYGFNETRRRPLVPGDDRSTMPPVIPVSDSRRRRRARYAVRRMYSSSSDATNDYPKMIIN
ncbi:hypothetical protein BLA29_003007 [Euroglyphus maynei]|uniref:Uncharacterized protein n=1 Tax=Euroglyphus maynei TaxID=6958 RepID=A0A1Y3BFA1_EURMA|nr:hypothetical protein BLA29_003007 [Euroglyphus maynei]